MQIDSDSIQIQIFSFRALQAISNMMQTSPYVTSERNLAVNNAQSIAKSLRLFQTTVGSIQLMARTRPPSCGDGGELRSVQGGGVLTQKCCATCSCYLTAIITISF